MSMEFMLHLLVATGGIVGLMLGWYAVQQLSKRVDPDTPIDPLEGRFRCGGCSGRCHKLPDQRKDCVGPLG